MPCFRPIGSRAPLDWDAQLCPTHPHAHTTPTHNTQPTHNTLFSFARSTPHFSLVSFAPRSSISHSFSLFSLPPSPVPSFFLFLPPPPPLPNNSLSPNISLPHLTDVSVKPKNNRCCSCISNFHLRLTSSRSLFPTVTHSNPLPNLVYTFHQTFVGSQA